MYIGKSLSSDSPRCAGTLTGFQWWIYDSFKSVMGLGTTGGK